MLDRLVEFLASTLDLVGLNGTRLRWKWNQRRRALGEASMRGEMIVRSARAPYKMCPSCRALVPRSAWTCSECGASLARVRAPGLTRLLSNLIPGATAATGAILLANGLMYVVMLVVPVTTGEEARGALSRLMSFDGYTLQRYGMGMPELTYGAGEWWRLITPMFLHGGIIHFVMNSLALAALGPLAEEEYGTERFAVVYLASGIFGAVVSQRLGGVWSVGASGAICGLLGLLLVHAYRLGSAYGARLRQAMIQNTFLMLVISFALPSIDWRGHLGGFVFGALFAAAVPARNYRNRVEAGVWGAATLLVVALAIGAFAMMALHGADYLRIGP